MVTDILNREIHVGDTVLRARTRNGRGVLCLHYERND